MTKEYLTANKKIEQSIRNIIAASASSALRLGTTDKRSERVWAINELYTGSRMLNIAVEELKRRIYEEEGVHHG